jgi:hypothetical protein
VWVVGSVCAVAAWAGAAAEGVSSAGYAMRRVPAGREEIGSPPDAVDRSDDEVLHPVVVTHALWVGATEVTQGQYRAVVGVNPSHFSECGEACPVEQVSWRDAVAFANALSAREGLDPCYVVTEGSVAWPQGVQCTGYRLPTEAEWEVAARGGGTGVYAGSDAVEAVAWTAIAWCGVARGARRTRSRGWRRATSSTRPFDAMASGFGWSEPSPEPSRARGRGGLRQPGGSSAEDDQHVLDGDDQRQGPDDHAAHAQHVGRVAQPAVRADLGPGVERRGADVAEDHAGGGHAQGQERRGRGVAGGGLGRGGRVRHGTSARRLWGGVRLGA